MTNNAQESAESTNSENESADSSRKNLLNSFRDFLKHYLSIQDNAQPEQTIEGIERDIPFKGFNLWILIPAVLIASFGLNANSTAVVIGAMLISPLMGPIMGFGLSVGINDLPMLRRSLRNIGIAVAVSIITSTIFFAIIPLNDASSELLARTRPDIRDVFIAFFGGAAGILAGSRKEKNNVIPGVAIATALMPPLCTAGYGLATLQFSFFLVASYLFLINAFFIALATVLAVRYLKFPVRTFLDKKVEQRAKLWLGIIVFVMIVPASIIFYQVVTETIYKRTVNQFIEENIHYKDDAIVKKEIIITDSINYVNLVIFGETIPEVTITTWQETLNKQVKRTKLRIFQNTDREGLPEVARLVDMYTTTQSEMASKDDAIKSLEADIKNYQSEQLPLVLIDEMKINYPEITSIKMGRMVYADFKSKEANAYPNFFILWKADMPDSIINVRKTQLRNWLKTRLAADSLEVVSFKP